MLPELNKRILNQKEFFELKQFLGCFAADADFDIFDEEKTIKTYFDTKECDKEEFPKILCQAKQILAMEPFPYEEVQNSADRWIADYRQDNIKLREDQVKSWLLKVLDLLEKRVNGEL